MYFRKYFSLKIQVRNLGSGLGKFMLSICCRITKNDAIAKSLKNEVMRKYLKMSIRKRGTSDRS